MLNLLPPIKKQAIEQDQLYRFIQRCCIIIISCTVLLSIVMIVSYFISKFVLDTIQTRNAILVNAPDQVAITQQLTNITNLSTSMQAIQKNFHQPVPILLQMFNHLPVGITFTSLNLDYTTNTIKVSGTTESREQLLELSQMINDQPQWTKVKFPLQDFTQKTNIPFEFEVTLIPS